MLKDGEVAERREFSRVSTRLTAVVSGPDGEEISRASVIDVSLGGVLIESDLELAKGTRVSVSIILGDEAEGVAIRAAGTVARTTARGLAIEFHELRDAESYGHLRNVVLYNSTVIEPLEEEIKRHTGIARASRHGEDSG